MPVCVCRGILLRCIFGENCIRLDRRKLKITPLVVLVDLTPHFKPHSRFKPSYFEACRSEFCVNYRQFFKRLPLLRTQPNQLIVPWSDGPHLIQYLERNRTEKSRHSAKNICPRGQTVPNKEYRPPGSLSRSFRRVLVLRHVWYQTFVHPVVVRSIFCFVTQSSRSTTTTASVSVSI